MSDIQIALTGWSIGALILLVAFSLRHILCSAAEWDRRPNRHRGKKKQNRIKHKGRWVFRDKRTGDVIVIKDDKLLV